jgi:glycosidase
MDAAIREFHISRHARDRYEIPDTLFSLSGNVVLADFGAARQLAHLINSRRDLARFPDQAIRASDLNAVGLIDEVLHLVIAGYRQRHNPGLMDEALAALEHALGRKPVIELLSVFVAEFPPTAVYRGDCSADDYLSGETEGVSHRAVALEELLLVWLANSNPAFTPVRQLFDDTSLRTTTAYLRCIDALREFFVGQPEVVSGSGRSLFDELQRPLLASPNSLEGQLQFIRSVWADVLGSALSRVLSSLDFLAEEHRPWFGPGPGPVELPVFGGDEQEPEAYSQDLDWMPRLVLLAKNAYVWLAQLSETYGRSITTLDEIPDQELERFASWGITGLWLIGVWERSRASERIKRMMGDHDAVASAYSLLDYGIADDLGGEAAYLELKDRAWRFGIRMATDMVPNHMGVDSRWVVEHPDWFIGLDAPPFPAYSFTGKDLCDDERVGVHIEDRYWSRTDAAVVFKRVDNWTGDTRFIYHGNDGTSMPWNDTAQLDYLNPEVREAVIQTILHVARLSPVIRFDAAMTLTRRHFQRLWYPEPGTGGDIPSRAEHGMTREAFEQAMPQEFWREVVDRVAQEAPDTLLLAEAFWLLEGYFVRSLGMHRVYNSAFMNMLRDERNADYRQLIKTTLEYDPQILKRYVNFMSNPDERTAVDQFGTDDKYFGVATLMATLPGLPMIGHGQIEGLAEKYGMEFRQPRWPEQPNQGLVVRHEAQLFPLLARRGTFAEVDDFLLYDFEGSDGAVDENVFAYSNGSHDQRSLVVYHNRFAETAGWIRTSTTVARGGSDPVQTSLGDGLGLSRHNGWYVVFRDAVSGLEFIRSCREIHDRGLYAELAAYELHVFVDFREISDDGAKRWRRVCDHLGGHGVPSVEDQLVELQLAPVLEPYRKLISADRLCRLMETRARAEVVGAGIPVVDEMRDDLTSFFEAARTLLEGTGDIDVVVRGVLEDLVRCINLPLAVAGYGVADHLEYDGDASPPARPADDSACWASVIGWVVIRRLSEVVGKDAGIEVAQQAFDDWHLDRPLALEIMEQGIDEPRAMRHAMAVRLLMACEGWHREPGPPSSVLNRFLDRLLANADARAFLGINRHRGVVWFGSESFDDFLCLLRATAAMETAVDPDTEARVAELVRRMAEAKEKSDFRVADLVAALRSDTDSTDLDLD